VLNEVVATPQEQHKAHIKTLLLCSGQHRNSSLPKAHPAVDNTLHTSLCEMT